MVFFISWVTWSYAWLTYKHNIDYRILDANKCKITYKEDSATFQYYKHPVTTHLRYSGCDPFLWEDDTWTYIAGLPEKVSPGETITIHNETTSEIKTFSEHDDNIDWGHFYNCFINHTFHDDLD